MQLISDFPASHLAAYLRILDPSSFGKALDEQATHPELQSDLIRGVAAVLFVSGTTFVLSSMWVRNGPLSCGLRLRGD